MFANFPFAFAIDLESGGIDDQVSHWAMAREAVLDFDRLGALADTAVVRRLQRAPFISWNNELMKPSSARSGSLKPPFEHQGRFNGGVAVMETSPSAAMVGLAMPLLDGLFIHPDGQRTALHQGLVVLFASC